MSARSGSASASGSASGSASASAVSASADVSGLERAERKKLLKAHTADLSAAIKLLPVYYEALRDNGIPKSGANNTLDVTVGGQLYQIRWADVRAFANEIAVQVNGLDRTAARMLKTHREVKPNAGFSAPIRYAQEIIDFFSQVALGPIVQGDFEEKKGKMVPIKSTLVTVEGSSLNDVLYFTQPEINGQANPLYGVIRPGILTPLYALHAYNTGMPVEFATKRLSASQQMRDILGDVMRRTIDTDVANVIQRKRDLGLLAPGASDAAIVELGEEMKAAIDDPDAETWFSDGVDDKGREVFASRGRTDVPDKRKKPMEIFNPNFFLYAHFSKLNANAASEKLNAEGIAALQADTGRVYNALFGGQLAGAADAVEQVIEDQKSNAALARAAKNVITAAENRKRKAAEKKAAAAAE
jgi:hypothetical protein